MTENIINDLEEKGCIFTEEQKKQLKRLNSKTYEVLIKDLKNILEKYLDNRQFGVNGITVGIRVQDTKEIIEIPEDKTIKLYDIASITKLLTLKIYYDLERQKLINSNEYVKNILPFKNMNDCKVIDIVKMNNKIETNGKLSETKNKRDFTKRLYTATYTKNNQSVYTDIGFIILAEIISKKINKLNNKKENYKTIMNRYLTNNLALNNTMFVPRGKYKILGNGDHGNMPHDPKTRINNGFTGAAGLFSNAEDFIEISNQLFNYSFFKKNYLNKIFNYSFLDEKNRKRSYGGIYLKTDNNDSCYIPNMFSKYSIAHQGYTGSIVVYDFYTKIHFSIFVDAIDKETDLKAKDFFLYLHDLKNIVGLYCIAIYMSTCQNQCKL